MFAKRLFYVSGAILMLALAYHLGARSATAQAPGNPAVGIAAVRDNGGNLHHRAITANGDTYAAGPGVSGWIYTGNIFGAGTPAEPETWGQLKSRYRGDPERR